MKLPSLLENKHFRPTRTRSTSCRRRSFKCDMYVTKLHIPHSVQSSQSLLGNKQFLEVSRLEALSSPQEQSPPLVKGARWECDEIPHLVQSSPISTTFRGMKSPKLLRLFQLIRAERSSKGAADELVTVASTFWDFGSLSLKTLRRPLCQLLWQRQSVIVLTLRHALQ